MECRECERTQRLGLGWTKCYECKEKERVREEDEQYRDLVPMKDYIDLHERVVFLEGMAQGFLSRFENLEEQIKGFKKGIVTWKLNELPKTE